MMAGKYIYVAHCVLESEQTPHQGNITYHEIKQFLRLFCSSIRFCLLILLRVQFYLDKITMISNGDCNISFVLLEVQTLIEFLISTFNLKRNNNPRSTKSGTTDSGIKIDTVINN